MALFSLTHHQPQFPAQFYHYVYKSKSMVAQKICNYAYRCRGTYACKSSFNVGL